MVTAVLFVIGVPVSVWTGREYQRVRQAFADFRVARARYRYARSVRRHHLIRVAAAAGVSLLMLAALVR